VSGTQCRSGRSGEGNTLSSPYENRTTPPLLFSLWFSHYIDRARGAREQFADVIRMPVPSWRIGGHAYFYKSVLFYLKTRTVHN
jgi:hypothetical protein